MRLHDGPVLGSSGQEGQVSRFEADERENAASTLGQSRSPLGAYAVPAAHRPGHPSNVTTVRKAAGADGTDDAVANHNQREAT